MIPYQLKVEDFRKTHPDFDQVVGQMLPMHNEVNYVIPFLDNGPEIAYFLGTNREYALSLSKMQVAFALVEIGILSVKLGEGK